MSVEQSLANLQGETANMIATVEAQIPLANAKLAEIDAAMEDLSANMHRAVWLDDVGGDDANDGSSGNPVRTLARAFALAPTGGVLQLILDTNNALNIASSHSIRSGLYIRAADGRTPKIAFKTDGNITFALGSSGYLGVKSVELRMDEDDVGACIEFGLTPTPMIKIFGTSYIRYLAAANDRCLFGGTYQIFDMYLESDVTFDADMAGNWVNGVAAGDSPANARILGIASL